MTFGQRVGCRRCTRLCTLLVVLTCAWLQSGCATTLAHSARMWVSAKPEVDKCAWPAYTYVGAITDGASVVYGVTGKRTDSDYFSGAVSTRGNALVFGVVDFLPSLLFDTVLLPVTLVADVRRHSRCAAEPASSDS